MFTLLEMAGEEESKGVKPSFPYWLSPTQLRLLPISDDQLSYVEEISDKFDGVRVDIDDSDRTVGKKIRDAEKEWIPYIAVIGSREIENEELSVRIRGEEKQRTMTLNELKEELENNQCNMPFRGLPLPKRLSKRPTFVG